MMIERLLSDHAVRAFIKASKAPKEGAKFSRWTVVSNSLLRAEMLIFL